MLREYNAIETNQYGTFIDNRFEKTLEDRLARMKQKGRGRINRDKRNIDKMVRRLKGERQTKKSKFSLEEDNFKVTHLGKPIDDEALKISNWDVDVDIEDQMDESSKYLYRGFSRDNIYKMVKEQGLSLEQLLENAGVSTNKFENKTKPQIIKEQILRSRYKKCKAQIEARELLDDTDIVDKEFRDNKDWLLAHRANGENGSIPMNRRQKELEQKRNELDIEYAERLKEMQGDTRAGASDRTITDLQKAKRNLELLTKMEKKRQRKQMGLPSESEDDDLADLDNLNDDKKSRKKDSYGFLPETQGGADDANMQRLEEMFDRAQKGYDDSIENLNGNTIANGNANGDGDGKEVEVIDGEVDPDNMAWTELLQEVADEQSGNDNDDDDAPNEDTDDDINVDGDNDDGYEAEIEFKYMPRKKGLFGKEIYDWDYDLNANGVQIGAEPAGEGEDTVFRKQRMKETMERQEEGFLKRKKMHMATSDFESSKRRRIENWKKEKRNNIDMNAEADWTALKLEEEEDTQEMASTMGDIPFTLDVPETINQFDELMSDKTPSQQIVLLKRMRSTNHVTLDEKNRSKIIRLYNFLLDYFRKLCVHYEPTTKPNTTKVGALQSDIGFYQYIDVVTRALFALSHDIPKYAHSVHVKKLETIALHLHRHWNLKRRDHFEGDDVDKNKNGNASFMPSGYALFYLKLVSHIFPTQNKANPVISAVLLILTKCLSEITINGPRDVSCALFCVTLILNIVEKQRRYVPEVIHSLYNILRAGFMSPDSMKKSSFDLMKESDDLYFLFRSGSTIWHNLQEPKHNLTQMALPIRYIFLKDNGHEVFQRRDFKIQSLHSTLTLIFKANKLWSQMLAYSELFRPFYNVLQSTAVKKAICMSHPELADLHRNVQQCLKEKMRIQSETRRPLQLIHKAIALVSLEPDFNPDLKPSFMRLRVRNAAGAAKKEARNLRRAVKKQKKAVMKELRKDTEFIQHEKTKLRIDADNKRHAKYMHEYHNLTEQQRDTNAFQMVGRKLRKKLMKKGVIRGFK